MDTMSQHSLETRRHRQFGRHRSGSHLSTHSSFSTAEAPSCSDQSRVFEGTDALPQNRKVALQRVIDAHHALDLRHVEAPTPTSTTSDRPTSSSSSISHDRFAIDFSDLPVANAEVRAFRYLLRKWDPRNYAPDPEFDQAIEDQKVNFGEAVMRHFFSRVALWDTTEEEKQSMSRSVFFFKNRRRRSRAKSDASRILDVAKSEPQDEGLDALKEVTTREGLAQLLWTLLHTDERMNKRLKVECTAALKEMYQVTVITDGSKKS